MHDLEILSDRERDILRSIINHYITHNEPVGSFTLSKILNITLSPATIRNIMSDLEEKGFLTHPHTSAGRVPTEKGYRFFVNHLLQAHQDMVESLTRDEYLESVLTQIKERAAMLSKISSLLSNFSRYVGIVASPKASQLSLKHIDFVSMGGKQCLTIYVTQSGIVCNKLVEMEEVCSQEQLDKMSRYVNQEFEGLSLSQIKKKIYAIMSEEKILYDQFVRQAIQLSKAVVDQEDAIDIYIGGRSIILEQPEFATPEKIRSIFSTFEEKDRLIKMIGNHNNTAGVAVFIGSENLDPYMIDCSLVMSTYQIRPQAMGVLGVLGPTRMRYAEVISMVDKMAAMLTRIFQM